MCKYVSYIFSVVIVAVSLNCASSQKALIIQEPQEGKSVLVGAVLVENNGIAYLRDIEISYTNGVVAVVASGIEQDENLIIIGQQSLKDSAKVKVLNQGEL